MGSSRHRRNSNSAARARSVQKSSKHRSKPTKPRTAADALRAIKHASSHQSTEQLQMSPTQGRPPIEIDGVEAAAALGAIRKTIELILSTVIVVAYALRGQNVELDNDAADVLRRYVSDELQKQIEGIDSLLPS